MAKKNVPTIWKVLSILGSIGFFLTNMILLLVIIGVLVAVFAPGDADFITGNVAVIPVHGVITAAGDDGFGGRGASSSDIVKLIQKADDSSAIDVILIEVNSPGGSPVASSEIVEAIKKTEKPTVSVIREVGASGGYWVASAADTVFANQLSITGSIGVIGSYLEIEGLLENYNVTYRRLVKGKYKDAGSPFKELTGEEEQLFDRVLQKLYEAFIADVAANRQMTFGEVQTLANGFVYLGEEALDLGLVDQLGTMDDAIEFIENTYNITAETVVLERKRTLLDVLSGVVNKKTFGIEDQVQGFRVWT